MNRLAQVERRTLRLVPPARNGLHFATAQGSYTDTLIRELVALADGTIDANPYATGALETASGLWARSLASARVEPRNARTAAITPSVLAIIGREWIRNGEAVFTIEVSEAGRVRLLPVSSWDITGGALPESWSYRCDIQGPTTHETRQLMAEGVIHTRYAVDPRRPWKGLNPIAYASTTGTLLSHLETKLSQEAAGPVGHFLPLPASGFSGATDEPNPDPLGPLKEKIRDARGGIVAQETTAAGWGEGMASAPRRDYRPERFGASPPDTLVTLRSEAAGAVLASCGVPLALVTDADGTSQRESWRRFAMGSLEPLAATLAGELSEKLETPVAFDFSGLWAHDLAGRAQALGKLKDAGIDLAEARKLAGL